MRLPLRLAMLFYVVVSCRRPLGPYPNTDKWLLNPNEDRRQLRDHPKEVTEYNYKASDTARPEMRRILYKRYRFNAGGDVIWGKKYFKDTVVMTWNSHLDANGYQEADSDLTTGRAFMVVSRRLSDGRYKTIENHLGRSATTVIRSFTVDGRECIRENFQDTAARHKIDEVHIYYDGVRVTKLEVSGEKFEVDKTFFYSRSDAPDSIVTSAKRLLIPVASEREYFFMNSHGDPILHLRVAGTDTSQVEKFQYMYDLHGNWIRRVRVVLKNKTQVKYDYDPKIPRVVDREFIY